MNHQKLANLHAATCFLNSLLLETEKFKKCPHHLELALPLERTMIIPVKEWSRVGKHKFDGSFYIKTMDGIRDLSCMEALAMILNEISGTSELIERIGKSTSNMACFLKVSEKHLLSLFEKGPDFISAEQALVIGHAFHPAPKSREGFSDEDLLRFSPETQSSFPLVWTLAKNEIVFQKGSKNFKAKNWLVEMYSEETAQAVPKGMTPFPFHPWQFKTLRESGSLETFFTKGELVEAPVSEKKWQPTSSLRTLYRKDAPFMMKFSLSVKLTNSIRHMQVEELDRGLRLHDVLTSKRGEKFCEENPEFEVIHEPIYAGLTDAQGNLIKETLIMGRENPFHDEVAAATIATLTQTHPKGDGTLIGSMIKKKAQRENRDAHLVAREWFAAFLKVTLKPLISAQADYGILLGAHQQNLILGFENEIPVKSWFRDCHGTGLGEVAKKHFPRLTEFIPSSSANFLFGYYVFINTTFNVLAAVGEMIDEKVLLKDLTQFLQELRDQGPQDPSFLDYVLNDERLMHKGNFFCSVKSINESTEANPLSIYTPILNPLRGLHELS